MQMKHLENEKGIALVTALMFTLICLAMIMSLMYYVLQGTKMSAAQKRYRNAVEASYGGAEFVTKAVIPALFTNFSTGQLSLAADFGGTGTGKIDFQIPDPAVTKLKLLYAPYPPTNWGSTSATASRFSVDPKSRTDFIFTLKGQAGTSDFKVYSKIVDTVPGIGLIDSSGVDYLDAGIGVSGTSSSTSTPRTPSIYTVEVQGEAAVNPREKGALTVLYAY